eukprot:4296-Heterococcus_DN1.PRE.2
MVMVYVCSIRAECSQTPRLVVSAQQTTVEEQNTTILSDRGMFLLHSDIASYGSLASRLAAAQACKLACQTFTTTLIGTAPIKHLSRSALYNAVPYARRSNSHSKHCTREGQITGLRDAKSVFQSKASQDAVRSYASSRQRKQDIIDLEVFRTGRVSLVFCVGKA